jgi:hypothetical protein
MQYLDCSVLHKRLAPQPPLDREGPGAGHTHIYRLAAIAAPPHRPHSTVARSNPAPRPVASSWPPCAEPTWPRGPAAMARDPHPGGKTDAN